MTAGRRGLLATGLALIGLLIAAYLSWTRLTGGLPVCGPLHGCETVALSSYSEIAGIPVAILGLAFSLVLVALSLAWWRLADRRALLGLYGLGLLGVLFVAYLTYLELFVIGAVCVWCAAYAVTIVGGWITAALSLRQSAPGS
ncbi:MAG TPA: vitamin K epoxide reductase family protein [Candidatus Limnocylindrales bacterium]|nr:vitamin K epoxide reductase family protein [Candidatus Limnocylindrales bacterium]